MATSTRISGPGGGGERVSQSQHPPKGAPLAHGAYHRQGVLLLGEKKKIFPPRFSPELHPPQGEDRGDHLPTAGGMLPMLLRTAVVPECGSSSTLASRVVTPSS